MNNLVVIPIEELQQKIEQAVKKAIEEKPAPAQEELLTRQEAADLLRISKVTLRDWTRRGWLEAHEMGDRVYYFRSEVLKALLSTKKVA